ncbi:MAG: trimethylamine methyltransferase family protein [Desulfobacterales bacterium]|nr:trimethylamine methyltransferase family protein [Desulfobacterales bacterium]
MTHPKADTGFVPSMKIMDDVQLTTLHHAVLEVLEKTGVSITHAKAKDIMKAAGCTVDGDRVRIPAALVEKAIETAPKKVVLGNRDGSRKISVEGANTYFGATIDCVNYLDPVTQELSECTSDNVIAMTQLCEALDNYDWIMTLGISRDMPENVVDRCVARIALEHSTKPVIVSCNDDRSLEEIHKMALLCQGGEEAYRQAPIMGTLNCTISPLTHDDHLAGKNIYAAENGIPIVHYSGMQLGCSFPATLASGIVMGAAESLSGLVLQQAINPGAPFVFGSFITVMDMKTTVFSYGSVEMAMMVGGMAQLAQKLGLPFFSTAGCTDAKEVDCQAAAEGSIQDMVVATVGGGLVHDTHCWLDHGSTLSPAHLTMGQEILSMVKKFTQGIEVTPESLALDLIDKIGPGGTFLMEPHTMKNFKSVLYPELFERTKAQAPGTTVEKPFAQRLADKTKALMEEPPKNPLPESIAVQLEKMQTQWLQE